MSVEFRQRTAGEFGQMLKRRKWLILLPVLTMTVAVSYVVFKLPSIYESKTVLIVKPPTISDIVVRPLSDEDLSQRLQSIRQVVMSRSSLEPMIAKYNLFETERNSGMDMALIIEKMGKNINVEVEKTDDDRKVAAFSIKYRDRKPDAARGVTAELAGKFVNAQVLESQKSAETTREFLDNQVNQAKTSLDALEKERLEIMMQNVETLPESEQGLVAQLQGLRQREQTVSKEKETLIMERGRLNDSIRALNSQARLIDDFGEKETQEAVRNATDIEQTPAYAQLVQKRAELSATLENLKLSLRDKHPEVIKATNDIEKVNDEIEALRKNAQKREQRASQASSRKVEMQKQNLEIEKQKAENQIVQITQQLQFKDQELLQNAAQIARIEGKINTIPNVKVALEGINNQYQSAKLTFDDYLKKKNDAQLQVERESNRQGETIGVQDPANLPSSPANASKKPMMILLGSGVGLAIGLFLAAMFEVPRMFKIQNIEDAKHYTGLPVLASVPPLLSPEEKAWRNRAHWLRIMIGIIAAIGSIPLIIMALQLSGVFERMVS